MHHIHHTTAFVIGHTDTREADRYLTLFTRELGVVRATAQGIRKLSSKLRFSLQDFSYARIDLVQGKNIWRITSAKKIESQALDNKEYILMFSRILEMIRRLHQGEESTPYIFESLGKLLEILNFNKEISRDELSGLEYITVLRILSDSGYIPDSGISIAFVLSELSLEKAREAYDMRKEILSIINKSLSETHL